MWIWCICQTKKFYLHDGKQLDFYKKVCITTESKKKNVLVIFILLQRRKNSNLFEKTKTVVKKNVKWRIQHEESWLWWIVHKTIFRLYYLKEICSHFFKSLFRRSDRHVFWEKWRQNTWRRMWGKVLQVDISQLHYRLTSSQITFRDFK